MTDYLIAGSIIAIVLFLAGVVLVWFTGLACAVWWSIRYVADVIAGKGKDE